MSEEIDQLAERGYFVRDGFAGDQAADRALASAKALSLRPAQVGQEKLDGVRGDEIAWLDDPDGRFEALRNQLNRAAFLGLSRFDVQAARYSPGAAYPRHRDAFRGARSRRLTAIWYLNRDFRGGSLRLHLAEPLDLEPRFDRLMVFLSEEVEHEVLPCESERWAITAWYY